MSGAAAHILNPPFLESAVGFMNFSHHLYDILSKMWWGLLLGVFFVGLIGLIPRDVVIRLMGSKKNTPSIVRAAFAGIILDLCSHGILLVSMKLYERGVRLSQVIAFLVASPWNSFSLTVILISLIGWKWTIIYIALSLAVAIGAGILIEFFVDKKILKDNPNHNTLPEDFSIKKSFKEHYQGKTFKKIFWLSLIIDSFKESRVILRWIFFGLIAASLIRVFVPTETFMSYFGPSVLGLFLTLIASIIIEVCSEGSVPIAYDLFARALAPGNAFLFLMAGASTDYTEIMVVKETTGSLKAALFIPLVTVPQILILGYILNQFFPLH
jgi:hypothetical protein